MERYISLIGLPLIVLLIGLWSIRSSNRLNRYLVKIEESEKNLDIALAKRYDTICEMAKVAKSFAKHEKTTLLDVIKLRQETNLQSLGKAIKNQNQAIDHIYALAETYPDLKLSQEFLRLQGEINNENEQLATARRIVNSNISLINQGIISFLRSLVAKVKGVRRIDFLQKEDLTGEKSIHDFNYDL